MPLHPPASADMVQTSLGTVWIWIPTPGVVVTVVKGVISAQLAGHWCEVVLRKTADQTRLESFHDWEEMTDYDGEARTLLIDTSKKLRPKSERVHILFRSKIVALGVRVASTILPHLVSYTDRSLFQAALDKAKLRHA